MNTTLAGLLILVAVFRPDSSWGQAFEAETEASISALVSSAKRSDFSKAGEPGATAGVADKIVPGISLEFYRAFVVLSHAAIRIEDEDRSFWQIELQDKREYSIIKDPHFVKLGIKVKLRGITVSLGDVILYNDAAERKSVEEVNPHQATAKVCLDGAEPRRPLPWYKTCLEDGAKGYIEKAFNYDPIINNCSHFAGTILEKCGLANCSDYPRSTGLFHRKGAQSTR